MQGDLSDLYQRRLFWDSQIEPITGRFLSQLLSAGDVFYDIGANCGYFTLLAASKLQGGGAVVAFEPNPIAREHLLTNLRINGFSSVVVRPEALGAMTGSTLLYQYDEYTTGSTLQAESRDPIKQFDIEVRCLDETVIELGLFPTIIKMDVEGWEGEVIQGAREVLSSPRPPILIAEVHEGVAVRGGSSTERWIRVLEDYGFSFLDLQGCYCGIGLPKRPRHWKRGAQYKRLRGYFNIAAYRPDVHSAQIEEALKR